MVNLNKVQKPGRYINKEANALYPSRPEVRAALCFPDIYDVGMSHLGLKILYHIVNSLPYASAERAFHPWVDYEAAMRLAGEPLRSLETGTPLGEFDLLGFSLQYELCYPTVLNMLALSGIPIHGAERSGGHPIVMAGGPCTVNPAPMSRFIDAFFIGDAEEGIVEIMQAMQASRGLGRDDRLRALSGIEGVHVPSLHKGGQRVRRRFLDSLETAPYPTSPVVPYTEIVHDRVNIEVARGCSQGCRFCQAGMTYRPMRERSVGRCLQLATEAIANTGYDEVTFSSLSAGDYSGLLELLRGFNKRFGSQKIAVSLPSLRVKGINPAILKEIVSVRKTGFTIAPEAATERLRASINKDFSEEDYERALEDLFDAGWLNLKLYYMLGLPGERDEDIEAIPLMVQKAIKTAKRHTKRFVNLSVSASPFTPKAHTPYQWVGQAGQEALRAKVEYLRGALKKINMRGHDIRTSMLEAALARGDERVGDLIEAAHRLGARLDAWSELFDFALWERAMEASGVDARAYATRSIATDEALPWDIVDTGVRKEFLADELRRSEGAVTTPGCMNECSACGLECAPMGPVAVPAMRVAPPRLGPGFKPIRVRGRFSKTGPLRLLSHRETITHLTRALKRAGVRLDHTQGFHPSPKVALGPPLSVGVEGLSEYFDLEIFPERPLEEIRAGLNAQLGAGIEVLELAPISMKEPSLQGFIEAYVYEFSGHADAGGLDRFEAAESFMAERVSGSGKVRRVDIRPMLVKVERPSRGTVVLYLQDIEGASVRLDEVAGLFFGMDVADLALRRLGMYGRGGADVPPFTSGG